MGYKDEISKNIFKYFEVKFSEIRKKSENLHPCWRAESLAFIWLSESYGYDLSKPYITPTVYND